MAESSGASAIFYASVDGTPRRFGAGSLPGLRYPWFKWFDATRSLPLPAEDTSAVYALSELQGERGLAGCLGTGDLRAIDAHQARAACANGLQSFQINFDGVARIEALTAPSIIQAGEQAEARILWQPLTARPQPYQLWLHVDDPESGMQWGNATLEPYPASQWDPSEPVLSRLTIRTDPTAIPDQYQVTLGLSASRGNAPQPTALWQGKRTERVPMGTIALAPGKSDLAMVELPADMQPVHGLSSGGLELLAGRVPSTEVSPGARVRVGLLWRIVSDAPPTQVNLRLLRENGEIVQSTALPIARGRSLQRGALRDEQVLELSARAPAESLRLQAGVNGSVSDIGVLKVAGRKRTFDTAATPKAVFGESMALLGYELESARTNVTVKLRWRAEAQMDKSYKIFVHVLDDAMSNVLAQRDAEPQDGRAPTPGWLPGEIIDDELEVSLPSSMLSGEYPIEVGVYEERSGERLRLPNGDSRVVLDTRLQVR
jgi:hypothetical protein